MTIDLSKEKIVKDKIKLPKSDLEIKIKNLQMRSDLLFSKSKEIKDLCKKVADAEEKVRYIKKLQKDIVCDPEEEIIFNNRVTHVQYALERSNDSTKLEIQALLSAELAHAEKEEENAKNLLEEKYNSFLE
jgi:hypothetical protein